jgi:hypothetical protein
MFAVTALLVVTGAVFVAGYGLRAKGHYDYENLGIYLASTILIYVAP